MDRKTAKRILELRDAIRAKCMDCSCDDKKEVEECLIPSCPLYPFRKEIKLKDIMYED